MKAPDDTMVYCILAISEGFQGGGSLAGFSPSSSRRPLVWIDKFAEKVNSVKVKERKKIILIFLID